MTACWDNVDREQILPVGLSLKVSKKWSPTSELTITFNDVLFRPTCGDKWPQHSTGRNIYNKL